MTRGMARTVACWLVGVLLFAQMAVAAYACPGLALALAGGMPRVDATVSPMAMSAQMTHCDDMAGTVDPALPNLCAEHCKQGQQSDHAATLVVPAAVLIALYGTPLVPQPPPPPRAAGAALSALVAACPPHTVLHCVYRI